MNDKIGSVTPTLGAITDRFIRSITQAQLKLHKLSYIL